MLEGIPHIGDALFSVRALPDDLGRSTVAFADGPGQAPAENERFLTRALALHPNLIEHVAGVRSVRLGSLGSCRRSFGLHAGVPCGRQSLVYTSVKFTETVVLEGLVASIGTIGDAYDNAAAETVMGLYKNEAVARDSPFATGPLRTLADVEELTFDWVDWYNNRRLHSSLGNIPPDEYERNYYAETNG